MTNLCDDHTWAGDGDCPHCEAAWGGLCQPAKIKEPIVNKYPQSASNFSYSVIFVHRESGAYIQFDGVYALCGEDALRFSRTKLAEPDKYVFVALTGEIHRQRPDY